MFKVISITDCRLHCAFRILFSVSNSESVSHQGKQCDRFSVILWRITAYRFVEFFIDGDILVIFFIPDRKCGICAVLGRIRRDRFDQDIICMRIMQDIAFPGRCFFPGIGVLQTDKFLICVFCILFASGRFIRLFLTKACCRTCVRRFPFFASASGNGTDLSLVHSIGQPVEMHTSPFFGFCNTVLIVINPLFGI